MLARLDTFNNLETEHAVFNGLAHALSGRIITKKTIAGLDLPIIEHVKIGLSLKNNLGNSIFEKKLNIHGLMKL